MKNSLFVITLWDIGVIQPVSRAIIAEDQDAAEKLAIQIHITERPEEELAWEEPVVDYEMSYQITCASDANGQLFQIRLDATGLEVTV